MRRNRTCGDCSPASAGKENPLACPTRAQTSITVPSHRRDPNISPEQSPQVSAGRQPPGSGDPGVHREGSPSKGGDREEWYPDGDRQRVGTEIEPFGFPELRPPLVEDLGQEFNGPPAGHRPGPDAVALPGPWGSAPPEDEASDPCLPLPAIGRNGNDPAAGVAPLAVSGAIAGIRHPSYSLNRQNDRDGVSHIQFVQCEMTLRTFPDGPGGMVSTNSTSSSAVAPKCSLTTLSKPRRISS